MRSKMAMPLFIGLWMLMMISLSACGGPEKPADLDWAVEDFQFFNQFGEPVGLEDLKGDVWLADFIFTNCNTVCPPMTANMANIQERFKQEEMDVTIVSFSVDPTVDTPEILQAFGEKFHADFTTWNFLTGYSDEEIQQFAQNSFKTLVQKDPNSDQVVHGTSFFLVDQSGTIVTRYDGLNPDVDKIVNDVRALRE